MDFALYCIDRFTKEYVNEVLKKAEEEWNGNLMVIQENEESNESDENYVKSFNDWNVNDIYDYHKKKHGDEKANIDAGLFAILSKKGASEGMFDIGYFDKDEKRFTLHKVRFELGSSCLACVSQSTLDIESFEPPDDQYLLDHKQKNT